MRISDWSSDVCSSDLGREQEIALVARRIDRAVQFGAVGAFDTADVMTGRERVGAQVARQLEQIGELRPQDRKSVVKGKRVSVRVDLGGRRTIKKKNNT